MATKDYYLSSKDSFIHNGNKKYSNLNLNQNSGWNNFNTVSNTTTSVWKNESRNDLFEDLNLRKKMDLNSWSKSNVRIPQKFSKSYFDRDEASSLSRNILLFENSCVTENGPTIGAAGDNSLKKNKWEKQIMGLSIQNAFEYPRQQNDENTEPEIVGYKASQQLLDPKKEELTEEEKLQRCGTRLTPEKLKELKTLYNEYLSSEKLYDIQQIGIPPVGTSVNGFKIISYIGAGAYGAVVLAERNNLFYAIKFAKKQANRSAETEYIALENNLKSSSHSHLLTACYFGPYQDEKDVNKQFKWMMVMKLTGICLDDYSGTQIRQEVPKEKQFEIFGSALKAIKAFHETGKIHRDIKPENFAVDINDERKIYLLDYGLVKRAPIRKKKVNFCGTVTYASRAALNGESPRFADDAESWANMLFEFALGQLPWHDPSVFDTAAEVQKKFWSDENDVLSKKLLQIVLHLNSLTLREMPNYDFIADCLQLYADEKYGKKKNAPYLMSKSSKGEKAVTNKNYYFITRHTGIVKTTMKCRDCNFTIFVPTSQYHGLNEGDEIMIIGTKDSHCCN